jgi:hypothetical protein
MKHNIILKAAKFIFVLCSLGLGNMAHAQYLFSSDSAFRAGAPMTGHVWGYTFGDYYFKTHSDSLNRGGANQFTGVQKDANAFDFRRVYLGYDFNISNKFSTELLLAAEDWNTTSKFPFFIKYANVRWKNIWKGTDLIIGQSTTPAFSNSSEKVWGYRSIERTIADIRRTSSYDLGISLRGKFDAKGNYGYDLMIGNGTGAKAENNRYKKFYGDIFAKFLDQRLMVDLYADYERLDWLPGFHHSMNMIKLFVGYTTPGFSAGLEGFINHGKQDVTAHSGAETDTLDANAIGLSAFVRGNIVKDKLGFFARADIYNPDMNYDAQKYGSYQGFSPNYNPGVKENFITAGLDFTPVKNVHLMPNIWYNAYRGQGTGLEGATAYDYDLAYRLTFYYVFGK